MGQLRRNMIVYDFADKVRNFIYENQLQDISYSLIMDYIDILDQKGIDLGKRDVEKEIYKFYNYYSKLYQILDEFGEEEFIDIITNQELLKK